MGRMNRKHKYHYRVQYKYLLGRKYEFRLAALAEFLSILQILLHLHHHGHILVVLGILKFHEPQGTADNQMKDQHDGKSPRCPFRQIFNASSTSSSSIQVGVQTSAGFAFIAPVETDNHGNQRTRQSVGHRGKILIPHGQTQTPQQTGTARNAQNLDNGIVQDGDKGLKSGNEIVGSSLHNIGIPLNFIPFLQTDSTWIGTTKE
jgi:hypothetical protein